jgi:hypothetical protein
MARPRSQNTLDDLIEAERLVQTRRAQHHAKLIELLERLGLDRLNLDVLEEKLTALIGRGGKSEEAAARRRRTEPPVSEPPVEATPAPSFPTNAA